ncbi:FAD-dependent monooxygenase [Streptomyces sp. NPDC048523]|uniref:FAD-dependent monooxygenase n=1 Tax=Streptomyces sp. NPDC048523 TaxID=3365567 RepID=UPI003718FEEC
MSDALAGEPTWRVRELLAASLAAPDFYFDALSQVHIDSWSTGRVALVGDAAWCASPASGAGAELALVGAHRLAVALATDPGDHRLAFSRYHDSHRALVRAKQKIGPDIRLMVPRTALGRRIRETLARLPLLPALAAIERLTRTKGPSPLPQLDRARPGQAGMRSGEVRGRLVSCRNAA